MIFMVMDRARTFGVHGRAEKVGNLRNAGVGSLRSAARDPSFLDS
jgi:hypothetical protein